VKAEYFSNAQLEGEPVITRSDLGIDFCYYWTAHLPGYPLERTSARWTGEFVAPEAGDYTLAVYSKEPVRLWLGSEAGHCEWEKRAMSNRCRRRCTWPKGRLCRCDWSTHTTRARRAAR
jgi:hypothetical protein